MAERNTGEVEGLNSDCACALNYATTLYNESLIQVDNYIKISFRQTALFAQMNSI